MPRPLADEPDIRADLAHTALQQPDLAALDHWNDAIVWRRNNAPLYHRQSRPCRLHRRISATRYQQSGSTGLRQENTPAAFTATTTNPYYWNIYGSGANYFYEIDAPGGIDVSATLGDHAHVYKNEIAMPGGIQPDRVKGLWAINHDPSTGRPSLGEYTPNPNYRPLTSAGSPPRGPAR